MNAFIREPEKPLEHDRPPEGETGSEIENHFAPNDEPYRGLGPQETLTFARAKLPKRTFSKELIELIFAQPCCRIRLVEQAGIARRPTATEYLRDLEAASSLRSRKTGGELVFINETPVSMLATD